MSSITVATERQPRRHSASHPQRASSDLEELARWMDGVFAIPGLGIRFGLDALVGLLPIVGDTATSFISIYILRAAQRLGVSRITLARMGLNVAIDFVAGAVPLLGDAFDVYWKANQRNVELLRRHVEAEGAAKKLQRADRLFVAALIVGLVGVLGASIAATLYVASWIAAVLGQLF